MAKFYLGVRIPNRAYESILLEDIDTDKEVCYLRDEIAKKIQFPKDEIELIYCGSVLDDNEKINEINLEPNTTVHVFKKCPKPGPYISTAIYTEEDYRKIAEMFGTVTGTQMNVQSRTNILQKILDKFPEFRKNLGAQALIRDSVLFNSLEKPEVIKKVAQNYSIICDAAEFIVKTTRKEITRNYYDTCKFTSGSEEETGQSQTEQANIRRISRDQLAAALLMAGTASLNSLSNIAQRNSNLAEEEQGLDDEQTPTSSTNNSYVRITPTIFNSALSRALLNSTTSIANSLGNRSAEPDQSQNMDTLEVQDEVSNAPEETSDNTQNRYAAELQLMREVGLTDDNINLQALTLSNGDVEAAINFVFGGMHNLFN